MTYQMSWNVRNFIVTKTKIGQILDYKYRGQLKRLYKYWTLRAFFHFINRKGDNSNCWNDGSQKSQFQFFNFDGCFQFTCQVQFLVASLPNLSQLKCYSKMFSCQMKYVGLNMYCYVSTPLSLIQVTGFFLKIAGKRLHGYNCVNFQ